MPESLAKYCKEWKYSTDRMWNLQYICNIIYNILYNRYLFIRFISIYYLHVGYPSSLLWFQANFGICLRPAEALPTFDYQAGMGSNVNINLLSYRRRRPRVQGTFKCKFCEKMLSSNQALKNHYLVHTGERPHVCKICNMSFTQLYNLRAHEYKHTGTSPYKCKTCNKVFSSGAHLRRHELLHSGERPYPCAVCGRRFSRVDRLRDHERSLTCQRQ